MPLGVFLGGIRCVVCVCVCFEGGVVYKFIECVCGWCSNLCMSVGWCRSDASIAQLGERQTEDLKVPGSIPGRGSFSTFLLFPPLLALDREHVLVLVLVLAVTRLGLLLLVGVLHLASLHLGILTS